MFNFFEASPTGKSSPVSRLSLANVGSNPASPGWSRRVQRINLKKGRDLISLQASGILEDDQQPTHRKRESSMKFHLPETRLTTDSQTPRRRVRIQSSNLTENQNQVENPTVMPYGSPQLGSFGKVPTLNLFKKLTGTPKARLGESEYPADPDAPKRSTATRLPKTLVTQESLYPPINRLDYGKPAQVRAETLLDHRTPQAMGTPQYRQSSMAPCSFLGCDTPGIARSSTSGIF